MTRRSPCVPSPLPHCARVRSLTFLSALYCVVWSSWSALLLSVCLPLFSVSLPLPSGLFFPSSAPFSVSLVTSQTTNERPNNNDNTTETEAAAAAAAADTRQAQAWEWRKRRRRRSPLGSLGCVGWRPRFGAPIRCFSGEGHAAGRQLQCSSLTQSHTNTSLHRKLPVCGQGWRLAGAWQPDRRRLRG